MKKWLLIAVMALIFILTACSSTEDSTDTSKGASTDKDTITYESENGPIEVPANPKRVIVMGSFAGNVMALDVPLVGVDSWSMDNPRYAEYLEDTTVVSDADLEQVLALEPDLIIGLSNMQNIDQLQEIAPTVTFTYGNLDYLTQHIEIGKLLNKEQEATAWVEDFQARAQAAGEEIRATIGEDSTVSVVENFEDQLYVFGDNWARGTEILYQEMKLKMPEKVTELALGPGYYTISPEALPDFAGDYLIISKSEITGESFQETETYKNIPAVKNGNVFEANAKEFFFNDPISLEYQLEFFQQSFLGE
ncbi:iron-hydroxamate ABC transporter substrate-binding protein [Mangrovibacillus cuniculi]|uniref:Iron-hydroxamate ABC transporter substrate-binding protein n=1 Tax=Mangrovibacillus cuniculi TaxID=2593652 RepID=A0A7S8HGL0_9BACI|nr:iron-hydroxamate ABC transporter substrate-binding protein [Mangrovibacillus cuniculi]QPC48109.1 iron-hydroxamate ABC transporter substrate-binding protein [Mangrovibacillus cuniculi]